MREQLRSLQAHFSKKALATDGVRVTVSEEPGSCPVCEGPMIVQKSIPSRPVQTLENGPFQLREIVHECAAACRRPDGSLVMRRAATAAERLLPGRSVGYDVMDFIGRRRFLDKRQREEIRAELKRDHGITLSAGEISDLARLYLNYVRRRHEACAPRLRRALAQDGGWPMHADATCEDGRGTMLVILAGWRRWVLGSWKIPTENAEAILACARLTVQRFGEPCAVMRDLGKAMISACDDLVAGLSATIKVLGCHGHFLADVGRDLLKPGHNALRDALRRLKMRGALRTFARDMGRELGGELEPAREGFRNWQQQEPESHELPAGTAGVATVRGLAQWAFDYAAAEKSRNFPFDRPYLDLYDRCVRARRVVDGWLRTPPEDRRVLRVLRRLGRTLDPLRQEPDLVRVVRDLRVRVNLFDELRETLRLSPGSYGRSRPWSKRSLTLQEAREELRDIRAALARFTASLRKRRPQRGPAQDLREAIESSATTSRGMGSPSGDRKSASPPRLEAACASLSGRIICASISFTRLSTGRGGAAEGKTSPGTSNCSLPRAPWFRTSIARTMWRSSAEPFRACRASSRKWMRPSGANPLADMEVPSGKSRSCNPASRRGPCPSSTGV